MNDPNENVKDSPGYKQTQAVAARTPFKSYPWATIAGTVAGIAGAHMVGYYTAGALANALAHSRAGASFAHMNPASQRAILGQVIGAVGSAGVMAAGLAHTAGQVRVARELSRLENERKATEGTKVASVYSRYHDALARMP